MLSSETQRPQAFRQVCLGGPCSRVASVMTHELEGWRTEALDRRRERVDSSREKKGSACAGLGPLRNPLSDGERVSLEAQPPTVICEKMKDCLET